MTDTVKAYFEGMLWAAYGVRFFGGTVAEWQLDAVKEAIMVHGSRFKVQD